MCTIDSLASTGLRKRQSYRQVHILEIFSGCLGFSLQKKNKRFGKTRFCEMESGLVNFLHSGAQATEKILNTAFLPGTQEKAWSCHGGGGRLLLTLHLTVFMVTHSLFLLMIETSKWLSSGSNIGFETFLLHVRRKSTVYTFHITARPHFHSSY